MQIKLIKPEHRKRHGKLVNGTLYLNEGVCYTTKPMIEEEKEVKAKNKH